MSSTKAVFIKTISDLQNTTKLQHLNLYDKLPDIRKELEEYNIINDTLSFSNNDFDEIKYKDEGKYSLREVITIDNESFILYLKTRVDTLNVICKLDYGRTISFHGIKIAKKRAF